MHIASAPSKRQHNDRHTPMEFEAVTEVSSASAKDITSPKAERQSRATAPHVLQGEKGGPGRHGG